MTLLINQSWSEKAFVLVICRGTFSGLLSISEVKADNYGSWTYVPYCLKILNLGEFWLGTSEGTGGAQAQYDGIQAVSEVMWLYQGTYSTWFHFVGYFTALLFFGSWHDLLFQGKQPVAKSSRPLGGWRKMFATWKNWPIGNFSGTFSFFFFSLLVELIFHC